LSRVGVALGQAEQRSDYADGHGPRKVLGKVDLPRRSDPFGELLHESRDRVGETRGELLRDEPVAQDPAEVVVRRRVHVDEVGLGRHRSLVVEVDPARSRARVRPPVARGGLDVREAGQQVDAGVGAEDGMVVAHARVDGIGVVQVVRAQRIPRLLGRRNRADFGPLKHCGQVT